MERHDALLAEYASLRAEILQNDKSIQRMTMFAFWAIILPLAAFIYLAAGSAPAAAFGLSEMAERFRGGIGAFLILPPLAYYVYLQMATHKLEGTARIAAYLATFVEPELPGLGWESRLQGVTPARLGFPSHVVLLVIATLGTLGPSIMASHGVHAWVSMSVAVLVCAASIAQLVRLRTLQGPGGYRKVWADLKSQG